MIRVIQGLRKGSEGLHCDLCVPIWKLRFWKMAPAASLATAAALLSSTTPVLDFGIIDTHVRVLPSMLPHADLASLSSRVSRNNHQFSRNYIHFMILFSIFIK